MIGTEGSTRFEAEDSDRLVRDVRLRRAGLAVFGVTLAVFAYQGLVDSDTGGLREIQDYAITHSLSQRTVSGGEYVQGFAYALPAVILKLLFALPGRAVSGVVWMGLMMAAAFVALRSMAMLMGDAKRGPSYAASLVGFVASIYFIQWDFESVNSNTIFLALVMLGVLEEQRGHSGRAGLLLATSLALKIYSAPLLAYLVLYKRWRSLAWLSGFVVFYFALLPVAWFGPGYAWHLTTSWIESILLTSNPTFILEIQAYKISLYYVALSLFGEPGVGQPGNVAGLPIDTIHAATRALQAVWVAGVGGFLLWAARRGSTLPVGTRTLIDVSLLLMTMLLLSPLLQPHHGTILWAPAAALAWVALSPDRSTPERRFAAVLLVLSVAGVKAAPSGAFKGLATNAVIVGYSLALLGIRLTSSLALAGADSTSGLSAAEGEPHEALGYAESIRRADSE